MVATAAQMPSRRAARTFPGPVLPCARTACPGAAAAGMFSRDSGDIAGRAVRERETMPARTSLVENHHSYR